MLSYQKPLLEDCFNHGLSFADALLAIDAIEWREIEDASSTWTRWMRERDTWGFYSY